MILLLLLLLLQVDSDGNTIPLKRNHRINHFYQRALNRSVDLHNYPRDEAAIPAVIRECFTDIQATRDYIITTSSSGYLRVLNSISLREVTSMDVFSLNLHREGGQGNPPEGMIYAPLSHLRILSTVVFEQIADPGLTTAAGRNAANTNGDKCSSDHISPIVSSFAISSRHVVLSIVSLEPAPLSAEATAEAQAALAAAATKKKPPPVKGAAEQPTVESATLVRLLVLDVLKHEETQRGAKEKDVKEEKERVGVQATQVPTGETIAQPARIEVINELFLQFPPSSSSVSSADTVHELMPSLMWDRIGVELSKDGCFMSVVGLPLGEACKLYALQPPKTMTMMEQSSNSTDQLPDDELLLQEIPAVTVTSPVVIGHLPSNAPFLLGGRLKSLRMVPNYKTLLNRDAAKQKLKTKTTEMMKEDKEEHRDNSYLLLKAFTEQTMLVVSLQDVHAALIVGLRLKSEDELVAKGSNAPPVLDAKGKAKPPDTKVPPSNANAAAVTVVEDKDNPTPIDLYLISQFKLTAALTTYAVDCSLRVLLATGTSDGTVTLWNLAQLSMVDCLGKHPSAVTCLSIQRNHVPQLTALSKASVSVVSGAVDGTLCFFKAEAVGAGVATASRASQLSVTIKGVHAPTSSSPSPSSPPHRRRDRSTSTTPGGGTAGILSRRRLDTVASRPSLLSDSSREGLEAIEHVVLKDYRSDIVVDTAAAVGAACVLDIRHHDYLPLVYVQYSNGMMVMYDCLNLQLLGRLEKRERINYVNIFSVMTSAHTLQGFDDPVKRAATIQKAIDDAAAAERQRIELLEQLAKAAAVEAEKAKKAGKPVPEYQPVITPAVVGVAAKVEEEVSKNTNKDRGGIDDYDDDISISAATVDLTENEINAMSYDAIRGKIIDSKTARFTYDYTWHAHRFLMTITHGHIVCLSERRGLVNIVMYPLDAMVDDMLSSASVSHSVASAPLDTGKAATSVPKNSSAMSKRVADTYSHLDHTMTSIDGKGTLKPLGKLRLTEERLHALDSSIAAVPVAADRRGEMDRDIIISRSHTAASSHRDLFFSRSAFDHHQQQSISAQTPIQLLQLNAVVVDPERIAQTAMVRSKQERERRKAKVQASSKVLANMLKPAVACAT